jgi:penicillin-insensitive murein endopeptidase
MWAQALALIIALDVVGKMAPLPSGITKHEGESITRAEANELMREPSGSLSHGWTSSGSLDRGVRVPLRGAGYAFFRHIRKRVTNYGSAEMAGFVARVGARMLAVDPESVVGIGNVSLKRGGRSRWHRSHQTGRDVDIAMFLVDRKGSPRNPREFRSYGPNLRSRDGKGKSFDVERNLSLVMAMVEDMNVGVQWIFCAEYLKQAMLEAARIRGVDAELQDRLTSVLHQPSDALPHDDHFHVRIYCSVEDRLYGCLDREPLWPWVDRGDHAYEARVASLSRILAHEALDLRISAVRWLQRIRARPAVPVLVDLLDDEQVKLAHASLRAIRNIGDSAAIPGILGAILRASDPEWSSQLYRTLTSFWTPHTLKVAAQFLREPAKLLHPDVAKTDHSSFLITSAQVFERFGSLRDASALLPLLDHSRRQVRAAAEKALMRITAHTIKPKAANTTGKRHDRAVQWWKNLVTGHDDWNQLLRAGLGRSGHRLDKDLATSASVKRLIKAVDDKRTHISHNAVRLLSSVTGHQVEPFFRSRRALKRHWRRWLEKNGDSWRHQPPQAPAEIQGAP